ncbi:chromosome segregation protein ScpA [Mesoplasma syrphidae]|uniref:Segregation and condensation protein A n=1 Tax=Mesoplasma syrphidae TaxID=225999 RepID=A0A2K9C5W2_9MOLU|nr:segregation/condensation protein A [Mesoplasma syrphidae]AUF83677.1 chromosome segregation protein ScpA [Mesoplasma syrphidae]
MRRWEEVNIGEFSGPLDILLAMVKDKKINIVDVNLIELSNQYIEYINLQQQLDIEIASEYLVMAAQLIELKSKMLLPKENDFNDQEDYSYEEFLEQLTQYEQIRSVTDFFANKQEEYLRTFSKSKSKISFVSKMKQNDVELMVDPLDIDMEAFAKIFKKVMTDSEMRNYDSFEIFEEEYSTITTEVISPQEIADMILEKMKSNKHKQWELEELLEANAFNIKNLISTFLAVLDLVRHQIIKVNQKDDKLEIAFTIAVLEDESLIKRIEVEGYE